MKQLLKYKRQVRIRNVGRCTLLQVEWCPEKNMLKPYPPTPQKVNLFGNRAVAEAIGEDEVRLK